VARGACAVRRGSRQPERLPGGWINWGFYGASFFFAFGCKLTVGRWSSGVTCRARWRCECTMRLQSRTMRSGGAGMNRRRTDWN